MPLSSREQLRQELRASIPSSKEDLLKDAKGQLGFRRFLGNLAAEAKRLIKSKNYKDYPEPEKVAALLLAKVPRRRIAQAAHTMETAYTIAADWYHSRSKNPGETYNQKNRTAVIALVSGHEAAARERAAEFRQLKEQIRPSKKK